MPFELVHCSIISDVRLLCNPVDTHAIQLGLGAGGFHNTDGELVNSPVKNVNFHHKKVMNFFSPVNSSVKSSIISSLLGLYHLTQ